MSETLLSVQGQLVGIPVEEYTGVSGIIVDPVNKTIRLDETVLWDGNDIGSANITLSESITNFKICRFKIRTEQGYHYVFAAKSNSYDLVLFFTHGQANAWSTWLLLHFTDAKTITVQHSKSLGHSFTSNTTTLSGGLDDRKDCIVEVVGINRIANN